MTSAGSGGEKADLEMRLVGPEEARVGETVPYELRVKNRGPDRAHEVRITHRIPSGGAFVAATGGGALDDDGKVRWPVRDRVKSGDSVTDTVWVRYDEPGRYENRATVSSKTHDPHPGNNEDVEPTTVSDAPVADVKVEKRGPATAHLGDTIRYVITTTNRGPDPADWVYVKDRLPEGARFVDATRSHVRDGDLIEWDMIGVLEPGASVQDTVWVAFPKAGTYVNRASVSQITHDPEPDNDKSSATTTVSGDGGGDDGEGADVEMRLVGQERATVGETVSYELRVRNLGPRAARDVRVRHTVPGGATFVSATGGGSANGDGVVTWPELDRLEPGGQVYDTVRVRYDQAGRFVNRSSVNADTPDPDPDNNEASEPTTVGDQPSADLEVVKEGPAAAQPGDTIRYLITTRNHGPDLADWVYVTDRLPEGAVFVDASREFTLEGGVVRWEMIHAIEAGASVQDTVRVILPAPGRYVNTATATQVTDDPDPDNDDSTVTTEVGGGDGGGGERADVEMDLAGPGRATAGEMVTYDLVVRNHGPDRARDVRYRYRVPDGAAFVQASDGGGLDDDGWVRWPRLDRLARGGSFASTVRIRFDVDGTYRSRAVVESESRDPDEGNNSVTLFTEVDPDAEPDRADVSIVKEGPQAASPGDTVTFLVTTTNGGPDPARGVVVSDQLPEGAVLVSASRTLTASGPELRWEPIDVLAAGESVQDTVRLLLPEAGVYVNTATVASDTEDPDGDNNGSSVTVEVGGAIDVALTQTVTPSSFQQGEGGTFAFTVENVGDSATTDTIRVESVIPAGITYQGSSSDGSWTLAYDDVSRAFTARRVDPLAPQAATTLQIDVVADVDPAGPAQVTHTGEVRTAGDGNPANDVATATVAIDAPAVRTLELTKTALVTEATIGDLVTYALEVRNGSSVALTDVNVTDELPDGFRFRAGTLTLDGRALPDPVVQVPAIQIAIGRIEAGTTRTLTYRTVVGSGTPIGAATNLAVARDRATEVESAPSSATVDVQDRGVFTEEALIVGKVFADIDSLRYGIPGVRVVLQDGTSAITDSEGNYSFVGLRPRLWVVRVDQSTLPVALDLKPVTARHAGRGTSAFADLVRGEMHRVDFGAWEAEGDSLWHLAAEDVMRRRRQAARAEENRGGGITWPILNGWVRDSTFTGAELGVPSAFGDILPEGSINAGNSGLGPRPADPVAVGLIGERATWDGPLGLAVDGGTRTIADGERTVPIRVNVDRGGEHGPVPDGAVVVTLEASRGRWASPDHPDLDPVAPGHQVAVVDGETVLLRAPSTPGDGTVRATALGRETTLVLPWMGDHQRPFLVTGLLEGQVDGRSLETAELLAGRVRDRLQDPLEEISFDSDDGRYTGGLRAAAFATGDVGAETSLTLRFDTEKARDRRFFRDIRPDDFYGVYGDASIQSFGAQSRGRVFGALARDRSFLMYGDFLTGSGRREAQSLGRYARTLNGVAQHFEGTIMGSLGVRVDGFASYDRTGQVVDELRGLGISGPYTLSRTDVLINSEQVEILVRDRNQPSIVLRRERLTRFLDYTVEPFTGRLLFKRPIPSIDDQLNPVSVRVVYEVEQQGGDRFWVYGADGAFRVADRLELGGGLVRDENALSGLDLSSANATVALTDHTFLFGELARSDSADVSGDAQRLELRHASGRIDARAYYVETDSTFSNPSSGFVSGRREVGLRGRADLTRRLQLLGEALRTESLVTGGEREGAQVALRFGEAWSVEAGYRYAEETTPASAETAGVVPYDLNAVRARVTAPLPEGARGAVFAEYEQDVNDGDQRRLVIGGDLRLFDRARLYGRHELISSLVGPYGLNPLQEQNNTVFGISADYLAGTQVFSEYRARDAFEGRQAHAAIGLRNQWAVADGLRLNTSFERRSPLGSDGEDALAVTGAVEYTANPVWKGTLRGEYRSAGDEDHVLGSAGWAGRLTEDWTLLGQSVFSHIIDGPTYERSRIGAAYRDIDSGRWNSLFRYEHRYDQEPREGLEWNRTAHIVSTHLDYRPTDRFTVRAQYGAKHVTEEVGDDEETSEPASLLGARIIYDIGAHFDVGVTGWALRTGSLIPAGGSFSLEDEASPQSRYAAGAELGWSPVDNLRIAGGYNAFGFIDDDFVPDQPTDHGFYVRVGYKIDGLWGDKPVWRDPPADVSVTKIGPERTVVDRPTEYWMYPRNEGPDRARAVELQDALPPGAQVLEASEGAVVVGDTIRWQLGNLEPGDGPPRYVQLAYPDTGLAVNEVRVEGSSPDPDVTDNTATSPTQVVPYELRTEKTGPASAVPDEPVTYQVTVTNLGPLPAESVVVRDSLPVGGVFDSAGQGGSYEAGVVTWPSRPLAAGESATYSLTLRYPLAGRYRNVVRVNAPIEPDRATHTVEIGLPADVGLTFFGKERAVTGDTILYRLHAYNAGPGTARNARLQVLVPPRGRVVAMDSAATEFGGRVAWSFGPMAPGEDRAVELSVVFDSVGLYRMEARAFSDFDDASETDRAALDTRVFDWDLDVALADSVQVGDRVVEYLVRTHNRGSGPAPYVVVEDSVAPGGSVEYASRGGVDYGDIVRWPEIDALEGGATQVDTVRVRYGEDGIYPNVAVASAELYSVADRVSSHVGLLADVRVQKLGRLLGAVGDTLEFAVHVYNGGLGVARDVALTGRVPGGMEVVSTTGGAEVAAVDSTESGTPDGLLTWDLGDVEPGDEAFLTYTVVASTPGLFLSRAFVESASDPAPRNDSAALATRIDHRTGLLPSLPDLRVTLLPMDSLVVNATGPAITRVGLSSEYEAFVSNRAPGARPDVRLTVRVPDGARVDSVSAGGVPAGDSVVWDVGQLGDAGTAFGRLFLTFSSEGSRIVEAVVAAEGAAGLESHADSVITDVVSGAPTLDLSGPSAVLPGDTAVYVVTLGVEGTGPLDGMVVEDSIPEGATFIDATGGAMLQGRVVRWPAATLDDSTSTRTDTLRLTYGREGSYVNRVTTSPRFPGVRDEVETVVGQAADVRIDLVGPESALVADTSLYYLHVYNRGNGRARAVETGLTLATGARLVSATEGGVVDEAGRVTWPTLDTMEPGAELFPILEIAYDRPGTYRHRATVSSEFDPELVNGSTDLTTRVLARRLQVRLRGPVEASVRDTLTYVVETTYRGPGRLDGGYVEKTIPESATFIGASGAGVQEGGVVRWPLTDGLAPDVTRADTVRLSFPYGGAYSHVAFAAAGPLTAGDTLTARVAPLTDPTPSVVYFDFDEYNLTSRTRADLIQIAQQIRFMHPRVNIALVGHADTVGATDYNDRLGQRRADSVRIFLESLGVRAQRIEARTRGELDPVSTEGTRASHARDRRVVFTYCDPQDPELQNRWPCNQFRVDGAPPPAAGSALAPGRGPPRPPPRPVEPQASDNEPRTPTP